MQHHSETASATESRPREKLKVFISYARHDSAFADELAAGLDFDGGFVVLIDRQSIHEGEDWKRRLGALIAEADTVVFVLSPASAGSATCAWEVEEAAALSSGSSPSRPPRSATRQPRNSWRPHYVRFDEGRSFMAGLAALRRALNTDLDWLREHTRLLNRAREWEAAGRRKAAC
ncbi:MAG: toll/interleukin-1 receptor domain-containing protein [Hyphomicrobiaceae bacterium]